MYLPVWLGILFYLLKKKYKFISYYNHITSQLEHSIALPTLFSPSFLLPLYLILFLFPLS